jgi:hypothetical protein
VLHRPIEPAVYSVEKLEIAGPEKFRQTRSQSKTPSDFRLWLYQAALAQLPQLPVIFADNGGL